MRARLTEGFLNQLKGVAMTLFTGHKNSNRGARLKIWICLSVWFLEDLYSKREWEGNDVSSHQRFVQVYSLLREIPLPSTEFLKVSVLKLLLKPQM